jgi:hypothetical protein
MKLIGLFIHTFVESSRTSLQAIIFFNGPWLAALETVKILVLPTVRILNTSNSHFPYFHHSRGLAALRLVDRAIDTPELWVLMFSVVARRRGKGAQKEANIQNRILRILAIVCSGLPKEGYQEMPLSIALTTISLKISRSAL